MNDCNTEEPKLDIEVAEPKEGIKIEEFRQDVKTEDDPYFYIKRDFTSEVFKIELGNLPKYIGFGELRKFLNLKMKLDTCKIKAIGNPPSHAFVTFRNEEERSKALQILNGYTWKKRDLIAKMANPAADPYVVKRKAGDSEESLPHKKFKEDVEVDVSTRLKNVVTPFWNVPYEEQLQKKEVQVQEFLKRLRRQIENNNKNNRIFEKVDACSMQPIKPSPVTVKYRNKCEFSVGRDLFSKLRTVGFRLNSYKEGSMSVAAPDDCINISEPMLKAVKSFEIYVRNSDKEVFNPETHEGFWRQLTVRTSQNNDVLLIVVMHPQNLTEEELQEEKSKLTQFFATGDGSSCGVTSVYFQTFDKKHVGEELNLTHLHGKTYMEEKLLGMRFQVSPESFFQVNVLAAELLYETIAEKVNSTPSTTVFDICCGTGTIGIFLAKKGAKVIGIEMCSKAVENAKINADMNGVETAEFLCGKAEEMMPLAVKGISSDTRVIAVANPPRAGLHPKVVKILRATDSVQKLVYVSCSPKSAFTNFVDLCRPMSNNYRGVPFHLVEVSPVDMFPHTPHYELVLVFERCTAQGK